jgi:hypothetical protein
VATIDKRKTSTGNTRYRVRWRLGGLRNGDWQSETFEQKAPALTFKLAVEACDHHWPENWIRGSGWASAAPAPVTAEPILFRDYTLRFLAGLSGIEEHTRHDYERDLKNHILPTFGDLDLRDETGSFDRVTVSTWSTHSTSVSPTPKSHAHGCAVPWRPRRSKTCTACSTRSFRALWRPSRPSAHRTPPHALACPV